MGIDNKPLEPFPEGDIVSVQKSITFFLKNIGGQKYNLTKKLLFYAK
jgi:hypothetical protein